ncbi:MAG: ATP-dependent Clp protease adapter ClpS [Rhodobacteraceae bacterium]|nr:ATP-dependent Clp protease adapter ClpS [Paracoccaceae bacterium]
MLNQSLIRMANNGSGETVSGESPVVVTDAGLETIRPRMYKVLILNDDFTPMEFVVEVLRTIFSMPETRATRLMLAIHRTGIGVAGVFTHEIAETKVHHVHELARQHEHPLRCQLEEE